MTESLLWVALGFACGFLWGMVAGLKWRRPFQEYYWIACRSEQGRPNLVLIPGGRRRG